MRRLSFRRRWLFRGAAMLCGILPFLVLELLLLLFGVGHDLRLVVPVSGAKGWYRLNPRFDQAYYGKSDLIGPEDRPFQLPKPPGVRRILVVGGSTVIGFPYSPELAFPRQLQVLLQNSAPSGQINEVLNAGITAWSSTTEVAVVNEAVACDPDLIVIYTGHNEFYGPGGVVSAGGSLSPGWYRTLSGWRRWRIMQVLSGLLSPAAPSKKNLLEQLAADVRIPENGPAFKAAVKRLEANLETMVALASRRSIPVLLVSPVSNERHQPPIEPALPQTTEPSEPAWMAVFRKSESQLGLDQPQAALPLLESITDVAGNTAIVQYRLAQVHDRLGNYSVAAEHYRRALDLDGGRFRAPSVFRDVFERVAQRHVSDRVQFLDLRRELVRDDPTGIPGNRHFLEHVHFTWEGNGAVAQALARCVHEKFYPAEAQTKQLVSLDTMAELLYVQPEDHLAAEILSMAVYDTPPFRNAADAQLLAQRLGLGVWSKYPQLTPARRQIFEDLSSREMATDTMSSLLKRAQDLGQTEEVGSLLDALVHRRPWLCSARAKYLVWLKTQGNSVLVTETEAESHSWPCP
ncbi:MAG: hypothetical protein V4719_31225 [Planctomycetota bacterium]